MGFAPEERYSSADRKRGAILAIAGVFGGLEHFLLLPPGASRMQLIDDTHERRYITRGAGSTLAGRYELLKTLGQGGTGSVFMAKHTQVERICAVKVLWKTKEHDERAYKRFLLEAKIAGSLCHVNLTSVYDYGETDEGYPFLVMDFVDGVSLAEVLKQSGKVEITRAVKVCVQICAGLSHAHDRGLVHRDLKPSNIMLVDHEGQEQVKIVDFGIAKVMASANKEQQHLTGTGEIFGTPFYASPEQCMGYSVDGRSDIYSLGCVLYEILTGQKPIEGENTIQTILMHLQEPPAPFSEVCPDLDLPEQLEKIVFKCLEKKPEHRYQTVTDLSIDLGRFLNSKKSGRNGADAGRTAVIGQGSVRATGAVAKKGRLTAFQPMTLLVVGILSAGVALDFFLKGNQKQTATSAVNRSATETTPPLQFAESKPMLDAKLVPAPLPSVELAPVVPMVTARSAAPLHLLPRVGADQQNSKTNSLSIVSPNVVPDQMVDKSDRTEKSTGVQLAANSPAAASEQSVPARKGRQNDHQTEAQLEKAKQSLTQLQMDLVPKIVQEVARITGLNLEWDIDWASFQNNPLALDTFRYYGIEAIRDAIKESTLASKGQESKGGITKIRIRNVSEIYERQVSFREGVLTIGGAWGSGIKGSPSDLEIKLAIAAAQ